MSNFDYSHGGGVPSAADIEAVMAIATAATVATDPVFPASPIEKRLERVRRWLIAHTMHAVMVMLVTAGLALYSKSQALVSTTLALAIISQLLATAMMIPGIIVGALFLRQSIKKPYGVFLARVQGLAHVDRIYVNDFIKCSPHALRYVLMNYRYERNGQEKRAGMLVGAIDKIGIAPALAGLVLLTWNLFKLPGEIGWAGVFGPVLFAFYLMAFGAATMTHRMDRVIALLDYSIQLTK